MISLPQRREKCILLRISPLRKNVTRNNVREKRPEKAYDCVHIGKIRCMKQNAWVYAVIQMQKINGILLPELFWPTVRKKCSIDREELLKFKVEGQEFSKFLRSLEQFIQTVKGQNNFW